MTPRTPVPRMDRVRSQHISTPLCLPCILIMYLCRGLDFCLHMCLHAIPMTQNSSTNTAIASIYLPFFNALLYTAIPTLYFPIPIHYLLYTSIVVWLWVVDIYLNKLLMEIPYIYLIFQWRKQGKDNITTWQSNIWQSAIVCIAIMS